MFYTMRAGVVTRLLSICQNSSNCALTIGERYCVYIIPQ